VFSSRIPRGVIEGSGALPHKGGVKHPSVSLEQPYLSRVVQGTARYILESEVGPNWMAIEMGLHEELHKSQVRGFQSKSLSR